MSWEYKTLDELGSVSRGRSKHRPRNDETLFGGKYPFVQTSDVKKANLYLPLFILTSYEDELYEQEVFDVYQIFDFERYLSEPQERVELHYKLIQQVVKYHKQLELWKKEIESLLPQKGQSAAIDKRILELDSKLEKSIDGHAAIPDEVKNDLKSNKLDELIDKIDLLLKED